MGGLRADEVWNGMFYNSLYSCSRGEARGSLRSILCLNSSFIVLSALFHVVVYRRSCYMRYYRII